MLFDFNVLSGKDRYKLLASAVVPRPIAWITTLGANGEINAAPYSFFNALAGDPPVIGIGIGSRPEGGRKDSGVNIARSGEWVVNLVPYQLADRMNATAIDFPSTVSEVTELGLETTASMFVAPPRLTACPVALECRHMQTIDLGAESTIVLGQVAAMYVRDDSVLDAARCHLDTPKLDLIGRMHGGGWYTRTTSLFEIARIKLQNWTIGTNRNGPDQEATDLFSPSKGKISK